MEVNKDIYCQVKAECENHLCKLENFLSFASFAFSPGSPPLFLHFLLPSVFSISLLPSPLLSTHDSFSFFLFANSCTPKGS